ncbi:MAG: hypothetical protein JWO58_1102 [Chitinophagaceae bacterium]|nr:hypothetical protein [Chitinophagaceae bacterium]
MKKLLFCSLLFTPLLSFAQTIKIDTVSFVTPDVKEVTLDASIKGKLEPFRDKDDAIVYIYRLSSFVGAAVKWHVQAEGVNDYLGQKEYIAVHIDTKKKSHWISHKYFKINYVNFNPNTYYTYRLKGYVFKKGYVDEKSFKEISTCRKTKKNREK